MQSDFFSQQIQTPNVKVELSLLKEKEVELWLKREDQIHPDVSGNKFRKLKYNIQQAIKEDHETLLTFGGAFSNHILATASAGHLSGLQTIGVIRGEELGKDVNKTLQENSTLQKAASFGMKLVFISREQYRDKTNSAFIQSLREGLGNFYLIPEGGTNEYAVQGCEEIMTKDDSQFDYICSCVGTGGTIAGLIRSAESHQQVIGFPALKGDFLYDDIQQWISKETNWNLITEYHFGGYGKYTPELIHFINSFYKETQIRLDPVYTGKMMFGIIDKIQKNDFPKGTKILAIHSGGLQGIEGFNKRLEKKNSNLRIEL
jgi:1-aminocyclopropane-1-carboxylate deaminase